MDIARCEPNACSLRRLCLASSPCKNRVFGQCCNVLTMSWQRLALCSTIKTLCHASFVRCHAVFVSSYAGLAKPLYTRLLFTCVCKAQQALTKWPTSLRLSEDHQDRFTNPLCAGGCRVVFVGQRGRRCMHSPYEVANKVFMMLVLYVLTVCSWKTRFWRPFK